MDSSPHPPARFRVYRSAGFYRRRRRIAVAALAAAAALLALLVAGVWAWRAGEGGSGAKAAAAGAGNPPAGAQAALERTPPPSATASAASPAVIDVGWVGDTTPGSMYGLPPDGGRALFAQVRDELRAPDLMIANLEGTYSVGGPSKCDGADSSACFAFQAPLSYGRALTWAGIDLVSLANNHAYDYLERGLQQTVATLEQDRVRYAGLPGRVTVVDVKGVRVAVAGFSPYPWNADLNDIPAGEALVRRAAREADVVIVLMHAGAEGADKVHTPTGTEVAYGENRGNVRAFAHAVVDAGADLVLGSGPHVIRGIERYRNKLIAYSLGNFAGWHNFGLGGNLSLSGLLTVRIDAGGHLHGGRWLSLLVAQPGVPVIDPADTGAHVVRQLSVDDFARTWRMDGSGRITVE